MKKLIILLITLSLFIACKKDKKETNVEQTETEVKKEPIKMFMFDGGTVQVNMLEIFSQDDAYKGQSKTFADAFYLIQHPDGNLLWDAGLSEDLIGKEPFTTPEGAFTVSRKTGIEEQLKSIGLSTNDVKYIALSHTHFDHSGSASKLPNAIWIVQENEYNFVTSEEQKKQSPDNFNAIKNLKALKKINGNYDVFGDGRVVIVSTPGHTPGHQSLFVDLEQEGPLMLTGDMYHMEESRENSRVPIFNHDVDQTLASMEVFETFAKEKGARVIIQHSTKDYNSLNPAPEPIQ
ncbi:glyoxylase-like metal-dependent hydrolase (beta-lactamase superfamily II) [Mesoflavibacter sabulilitoris]|uniref:MBL fold metallo-hydrolase n=1 Tax=Mesoflavibacter zeaxanthinifaciens subsp. sabulilitoris TaxID=1520893 RepID=A0A2T1N5U0_9FLAO|nr:N-acyl homoserine lactonase family protein [Mesoflavibacter zeaxanthinifaciens]MBB3123421.1 glyoxylase-like metal-dependent hydrolase (beta-lactamase superfamily II) [Mesoflavibacter zeaxanthinifaciens subsp. sabulilitoris]PSG86947.1 MBL fold metallo-hydrolase [Mesoflavibacter zeaxanthinifaciens subsp. sabulilitoris]